MNYIRRHWRGELPLGQAFWINLVLIRALLTCGDLLFQPPITKDIGPLLPVAAIYSAISILIVLPWQVVGVIRSTDRMLGELGSSALVTGAQIGAVFSFLVVGSSAFATFQPLWREPPPDEPHFLVAERERRAKYALSLLDDGTTVEMSGEFEIGVTRDLRTVLDDHPGATRLALSSDGGYVNQGRAVARLIEERGLDTVVLGTCKSACVIAYMAGRNRLLGPDGAIGFHQYFYEGRVAHPTIDQDAEFRRDLDYFISRGVDPVFLDDALAATHDTIWLPDASALVAAGVVHTILPPP